MMKIKLVQLGINLHSKPISGSRCSFIIAATLISEGKILRLKISIKMLVSLGNSDWLKIPAVRKQHFLFDEFLNKEFSFH